MNNNDLSSLRTNKRCYNVCIFMLLGIFSILVLMFAINISDYSTLSDKQKDLITNYQSKICKDLCGNDYSIPSAQGLCCNNGLTSCRNKSNCKDDAIDHLDDMMKDDMGCIFIYGVIAVAMLIGIFKIAKVVFRESSKKDNYVRQPENVRRSAIVERPAIVERSAIVRDRVNIRNSANARQYESIRSPQSISRSSTIRHPTIFRPVADFRQQENIRQPQNVRLSRNSRNSANARRQENNRHAQNVRLWENIQQNENDEYLYSLLNALIVQHQSNARQRENNHYSRLNRRQQYLNQVQSHSEENQDAQSFVYKNPKDSKDEYNNCIICMEALHLKKVIALTCMHMFHSKCIRLWMSCKKLCPVCRRPI